MNGKLLWEKDLGDKRMRNEFGEGSTPALHGNTIVVVWDHLNGESFIAALDKRDGKELWRAAAQGDRHLGDAADPRRQRPAAGDRAGDGAGPQLRPGDRPASSGRATG